MSASPVEAVPAPIKKAWRLGQAFRVAGSGLLDLGFLIRNVLADNRIVLFDLDFSRGVTLVLVGRVKVTSAC
jgi:hypothetical protein